MNLELEEDNVYLRKRLKNLEEDYAALVNRFDLIKAERDRSAPQPHEKIKMIKYVRTYTGCSLIDAKELVEEMDRYKVDLKRKAKLTRTKEIFYNPSLPDDEKYDLLKQLFTQED